jgi:SAM-dependent methyltransferase
LHPASAHNAEADELARVQARYPQFRIWREDDRGRVRYIARSQHPGLNPHTVVAADLSELRAALSDAAAQPSAAGQPFESRPTRFDPAIPHPARVYNVWLGGKDGLAADRRAAAEVAACRPQVVAGARANREFLGRVVRYLAARRGVRQFLDIGPGLPAPGNTHEVAQAIAPDSRVVYVDNDPMVLAHARALLTSTRQGACGYLDGDVRDPEAILKGAAQTLDFTRPTAVILVAVLHFLADADDPADVVATLAAALAPGGFVAISHLTADFAPEAVSSGIAAYNSLVPAGITARSHAEVTGLIGRLSLVAPGVVPVSEWRPDHAPLRAVSADVYAGLATVTRRSRTGASRPGTERPGTLAVLPVASQAQGLAGQR